MTVTTLTEGGDHPTTAVYISSNRSQPDPGGHLGPVNLCNYQIQSEKIKLVPDRKKQDN